MQGYTYYKTNVTVLHENQLKTIIFNQILN
jgi:hypothetical protein